MTRTNPTLEQRLALEQPCDYCAAAAPTWCVTSSGAPATHLHSSRTWATESARWLGYCDGSVDATDLAIQRIERSFPAGTRHPQLDAALDDLRADLERRRAWYDQAVLRIRNQVPAAP